MEGEIAVGVPLITQFVLFMVSPAGRVGLMEQLVILPVTVGVMGTIAPVGV